MGYLIAGLVLLYIAERASGVVSLVALALIVPVMVFFLYGAYKNKRANAAVTLSPDGRAMDEHVFTNWCVELLRQNGFTDVSVAPGGSDRTIDVLACKDGQKYAVRCKCSADDLDRKPVREAAAGRAAYGCGVAVVMTDQHFTKGAVKAAKAAGVQLWDREKLAGMAQDAPGAETR